MVCCTEHYSSIDFLKGLAILGVITMHSTSYHIYGPLIEVILMQSVPTFLILMGTVGAMSLNEKGFGWQTYFPKRIRRLVVPLIPIFFVTTLISIVFGKQMYLGWGNLIGELPLSGPGAYFVALALASIVIIPALWRIARKSSMATMLVGSFLISLNLELFPQPGFLAMIFRNLFFFAIGIYLATVVAKREVPKILISGIVISIILVFGFTQYQVFDIETLYGNCLTALFTCGVILVVVFRNLSWKPIGLLGKASWHLFLTQMVVLLVFNRGLILNLIVILPIGLGFYYLDAILQSREKSFFDKSVE